MNYVQPGNIETNLYFQVSLPLCLLIDQLKYMYPTLKKYILFYHLQYMEYSWNKFHFTYPFPGAFAPAGPSTIWKRRINFKDSTETRAYEMLMKDSAHDIVPEFFREVEYNGECILFLST